MPQLVAGRWLGLSVLKNANTVLKNANTVFKDANTVFKDANTVLKNANKLAHPLCHDDDVLFATHTISLDSSVRSPRRKSP
jgi:hypothetical protein